MPDLKESKKEYEKLVRRYEYVVDKLKRYNEEAYELEKAMMRIESILSEGDEE